MIKLRIISILICTILLVQCKSSLNTIENSDPVDNNTTIKNNTQLNNSTIKLNKEQIITTPNTKDTNLKNSSNNELPLDILNAITEGMIPDGHGGYLNPRGHNIYYFSSIKNIPTVVKEVFPSAYFYYYYEVVASGAIYELGVYKNNQIWHPIADFNILLASKNENILSREKIIEVLVYFIEGFDSKIELVKISSTQNKEEESINTKFNVNGVPKEYNILLKDDRFFSISYFIHDFQKTNYL